MSPMRPTVLIIVLVLGGIGVAPPAAEAHAPGSDVVSASGSVLLAPNATFHAYLSSLGLPIGAGDTLRFSWFSNRGAGPAVYFEIHSHPSEGGIARFYNATASEREGAWGVPGSDPYMVFWENRHAVDANVTYTFHLVPPPPDLWPLALLGVVALGSVGVWLFGRRKANRAK